MAHVKHRPSIHIMLPHTHTHTHPPGKKSSGRAVAVAGRGSRVAGKNRRKCKISRTGPGRAARGIRSGIGHRAASPLSAQRLKNLLRHRRHAALRGVATLRLRRRHAAALGGVATHDAHRCGAPHLPFWRDRAATSERAEVTCAALSMAFTEVVSDAVLVAVHGCRRARPPCWSRRCRPTGSTSRRPTAPRPTIGTCAAPQHDTRLRALTAPVHGRASHGMMASTNGA